MKMTNTLYKFLIISFIMVQGIIGFQNIDYSFSFIPTLILLNDDTTNNNNASEPNNFNNNLDNNLTFLTRFIIRNTAVKDKTTTPVA